MTSLASLVETSGRIAATSKRTEKTALLANLLEQMQPEEVETAVLYLSGSTRQGRTGVGYASLRDMQAGHAAQPTLTIRDVDHALQQFAETSGRGSAERRRELLAALFRRATEPEARFLSGLLTGELRQGALEGIMLDAIAKAARIPSDRIRRAAMMAGGIAEIARAALSEGEPALSRYEVTLFRPIQPMLAQTAEDAAEAIEQLGEASLEYKFDGARVQAHKSGDDVAIYSRNLNDVTTAVPEIAEAIRALPVGNMILDGEVLAFDPSGRPYPFQTTMRRFGRRLDVNRMRQELPVQPVWFDALYLNGGSLIDEPQAARFSELQRVVPGNHLVPSLRTSDPEEAARFVRSAIEAGNEGAMAKALNAGYAAGARGAAWLKIKQARTLDLVILAAEWGSGRRRGYLSNLHLGARDAISGGFVMLGKTFKGLTDEMLAWQTQEFQKIEAARDAYTVYLEPVIVAEIAFNEIQVSPRYPGGLALRFARVKRYRPDKKAADADTFQTVQTMAGVTAVS